LRALGRTRSGRASARDRRHEVSLGAGRCCPITNALCSEDTRGR
jgi:hypothetical protein